MDILCNSVFKKVDYNCCWIILCAPNITLGRERASYLRLLLRETTKRPYTIFCFYLSTVEQRSYVFHYD